MGPSKKSSFTTKVTESHVNEVHARDERMEDEGKTRVPTRLILCFDGTGNSFSGNTSDTNIVKLYNKFDRCDPHQMHYYQPGIGTYPAEGTSVNTNWWGQFKRNISATIDEMFATSFDTHVMAGYRFLMRYYGEGDRIYVFGFSRGAFTAAFLSRMVAQIGLLSRGNEELVPFAYKTFQDYEMGKISEAYLKAFNDTYCRHEHVGNVTDDHESGPAADQIDHHADDVDTEDESEPQHAPTTQTGNSGHSAESKGVKVHFLGLFDTVNSVGNLDVPFTKSPKIPKMSDTAEHIRHAVAVDERRVKFKPALLDQDLSAADKDKEDILEVWFPGNHGDVGGGWAAPDPHETPTAWQKFKNFVIGIDSGEASEDVSKDNYQQSDIALKWMIDELDKLGETRDKDGKLGDRVKWNEHKDGFLDHFKTRRFNAVRAPVHDTMRLGGGSGIFKVMMWNLIDRLPLFKRWEYLVERRWWEVWGDAVDDVLRPSWLRSTWTKIKSGFGIKPEINNPNNRGVYPGWNYVFLPLNQGACRDIPPGAVYHHSVLERMHLNKEYDPKNVVFLHEARNAPIKLRDAETRPGRQAQSKTPQATEHQSLLAKRANKANKAKRFVFKICEGYEQKLRKDRIYQIVEMTEAAVMA